MVAEVASTVNEVLLTKYLLSTETDKKRRAYILNHFLEGFRTTIFRQTLFAEFEKEAHKVQNGIYEASMERDVFLAYSGKDMKAVVETLNFLEENGLTCFAAFRNMQHGKDAVANYEKTLYEAIDNCKIFLFISSKNSRSYACDAFKKEIAYVKNQEMNKFPEYRNYEQIPDKYKKLRIEYRLDNAATPIVDKALKSFLFAVSSRRARYSRRSSSAR